MDNIIIRLPSSGDGPSSVAQDFFAALEALGDQLHAERSSQRYIRSLKIEYAPRCFPFFSQLGPTIGGVDLHMTMDASLAPGAFTVAALYGQRSLATCMVAPESDAAAAGDKS